MEVKFLGEIPLNVDIRINSDKGQPNKTIKNSHSGIYYDTISEQIIDYLETIDQDDIDGPTVKFE